MNKLFSSAIFTVAIIGISVVFSSSGCRKKKDTIAKIYVYDVTNNAVEGAEVNLSGESTMPQSPPVALFKTSTTNGAGEAIFNFNDVYQLGQAGVAVLNIDASKGSLVGSGIIKIEQETTSEEAVFVQ